MIRNTLFSVLISLVLLCASSASASQKEPGKVMPNELKQTIYYGGDIITMEGDEPAYVEAVIERDGKIIYAGKKSSAVNNFAGKTIKVNLKGKTMMPGFIEPHAHPVSIGAFILANDIVAPHEWRMPHKTYPGVSGKENYLKAVKDIIDSKEDKTETVLIWGYHKSWHGELTLADLDRVTGDVPTIIWQRSTHEIYLNTAGARKYGVKKGDLSEADDEQADWDNYHFWERAYQMTKGTKLAPFFGDKEMLRRGMDRISTMMLQNGLTAMTEPGFPTSTFDDEYTILKEGTEKAQAYTIYLISGFPEQFVKKTGNDAYAAHIESLPEKYNTEYIKFLPKQYKTFADGAIYSLALELREPFYNCENCKSEWIIPLKEGEQIFDYWWDKGYKIHIHITGDLAFEEYLDMVERAMKRHPRKDHRTTFHHVGLFDAGQAQRTADLGVEISANPYYIWALADKYSETGLGPERAASMVALKEFTRRGVPVSLHSDFAMAPAEPLLLAWVAANRVVASGKVMIPDESISVYEAMKGITITAARTFEMEHEIGSIKVGKQATFTLLEQNPFKIDPVKIKDIPIAGIVYKGNMKLNKGKLVGADRDAHGCIGSAGYSWCEKTGSCERPWELAKKHGFENTKEAFDSFCKNPAP
jgi:predicted amidohydrolase YtcJ